VRFHVALNLRYGFEQPGRYGVASAGLFEAKRRGRSVREKHDQEKNE